jgi:ribosomal protein S18 acetylase RimI-like enzyme
MGYPDYSDYIVSTPWDARAIGMDSFEITEPSEEILRELVTSLKPGHYMIKIDPIASKKALHECGFYYCDTLLEPYCTPDLFVGFQKEGIRLSNTVSLEELLNICDGAFVHGRFHRDFNIDKKLADARYNLWLKDIYQTKNFFGLIYFDKLVGFIGFSQSKLILHALSEEYRGQGLAKYFWSLCCQELFKEGSVELTSSISASNLPMLNLYTSLGFRFRKAIDYYHLLIPDS